MKPTIANSISLIEARDVISKLESKFDSHQFIDKFKELYPHSYDDIRSRYNEVGKAHAQIGKYLSKNRSALNIESQGKHVSINVKGYKSSCELWRKI